MGVPPNGYFPFPTSLSLDGLIRYWEAQREDPSSPLRRLATDLLARVERAGLRGTITEPERLDRHHDLIAELHTVVFPIGDSSALGATGEPFRFTHVFETDPARDLGLFSAETFTKGNAYTTDLMEKAHVIAAYEQILQKVYGRAETLQYPLVLSVRDEHTGLLRHFQLSWDPRFFRIVPRGELPRPSEATIRRLIGEPTNMELWTSTLPPERFELSGLAVVRATDVTMREALSRLKDSLLEHHSMSTPARVERLQGHIRTILGLPDLEVGILGFGHAHGIDAMDNAVPVGRSLLLSDGAAPQCPEREDSNYAAAMAKGETVVVSDMEHAAHCTGFEHHLMRKGLASLLVQPLFTGDRLIGALEIASPRPGALTVFHALMLTDVAEPFATALEHSLDEREDRVQSIIKQQYTAIHPSVEWRFRAAALRFLHDDGGENSEPVTADQVVFPDVYPLYGLTDIRSSSEIRGKAVQMDLIRQLELAFDIVKEAGKRPSFPLLTQIGYRIGQFLARINEGLHSDDETAAVGFLARELEPILDELAGWNEEVENRVQAYRAALHPQLGVLYRSRRDFDESVMRFNEAVSGVIDRQQEAAQSVFPHFFEKFQTDGVDYNIYVGESLAERGGFSELHLHNLRLWQLELVCRIEWELDRVRPELAVDLAATHLVLVQDQPLAIRFRTDEKRFDVDGAYNIRYELVKKRIDKARIRHSGERLTQPGTLAVVYSQTHEAQEYRRYLEYLTASGFLTGDIEEHDLEDMQGVLGLRAFRAAINKKAGADPRAQVDAPSLLELGVGRSTAG